MPEVQSRSLMMVEAVVQGQVQAMEAMSEREFVSQDREVAHTWGGGYCRYEVTATSKPHHKKTTMMMMTLISISSTC